MTGMMKRILSAFVAAVMLFAMSAFVAVAEEAAQDAQNDVAVRFTVGEADENGIFTAELSVHNVQFISYQFGITFDKNSIHLVDEAGEPADSFADAAVAHNVMVGGVAYPLSSLEQRISNEAGTVHVAAYFFQPSAEERLVSADANGVVLYTFRFKEIADGGNYGFALQDWDQVSHGKYALLNNGLESLNFTFEFVYPEAEADKNTSDYYERNDKAASSEQPVIDDSLSAEEQLRKERLAGTIVLQINNYAVSVDGVLKWVDKDNKNVIPYIENDRTMVPLRFISEAMGAEVTWVPETRTIDIALGATAISMQIDNTSYTIDGAAASMDVAPVIREDRTMVPLRFVSEALSKSVYWNEATSVVIVAPIDNPWDDKDPVAQQLMTDTLWMFRWLRDEAYANQE